MSITTTFDWAIAALRHERIAMERFLKSLYELDPCCDIRTDWRSRELVWPGARAGYTSAAHGTDSWFYLDAPGLSLAVTPVREYTRKVCRDAFEATRNVRVAVGQPLVPNSHTEQEAG